MREIKLTNSYLPIEKRFGMLTPIALLWGITFFTVIVWLLVVEQDNLFPHINLLGWVGLTAVVIAVPNIVLYRQNEFKIYNPIVFASMTYFFPAMVIGGLFFLSGMSNPYFVAFIQDYDTDVSMTFWAVILGFSGLSLGYLLPVGKKIGHYIEQKLPVAQWNPENTILPTLFLMTIGIINSFFAFTLGLIGFQKAAEIGEYDGLIYVVTMFSAVGFFLLCLTVFKIPKLSFNLWLVVILLSALTVGKALLAGNRGSLLTSFIVVAIAFTFSGRKTTFNQKILTGLLLFVLVFVGMIYGTTFRNIKGSEDRSSVDEYLANIEKTVDTLGNQDVGVIFGDSLKALAERIDAVSSLAVVVSNYERLAPYEESYGLDNNIIKDTLTFAIPRVIWADKPVASEPRRYGDLYFNYSENSFTITPMGDLLRNFGWEGVFIGMFLLGTLKRVIYVALVEKQAFSLWRITLYFMLLTSVSYEGFYGAILPFLVKVCVISTIGLLVINFFTKKNGRGNVKI
jgi:hypothetical protein